MDRGQYTTLMEVLKSLPDRRKARGKRYSWTFLLALICCALASGQRSGHAIAHWISEHAAVLCTALSFTRSSVPSESTIRRALRALDVDLLEQRLAQYHQRLASTRRTTDETMPWQGQAVDGKELRGVRAHGQPLCLVSLVVHGSGIVLAQTEVNEKSNEITAVPQLLAGRDLHGTVITMDALLTQQMLAQQIIDQQGHYLMIVKLNQGRLHDAIRLLFDYPPWTRQTRSQEYWLHRTFDKGHGRHEWRTLECSTALGDYLPWPGIKQVMRRTCKRLIHKTDQIQKEVTYGITSLSHDQASAAQIESLWRGHWTIENRLHYVRDVTMGEDTCQIHRNTIPHVLATLRNAIISLFRVSGWSNIADAIRHFGASVYRPLQLIGALPF